MNRPDALRAALVIVLLVTTLLGGALVWKLGDRLREIEQIEQSDPLWITSQLQFELLRLQSDTQGFILGSRTAQDVALRFDIVWSRATILQTGSIRKIIGETGIDSTVVDDLLDKLVTLDPLIASLAVAEATEATRRQAGGALLAELAGYDGRLRDFSIAFAQAKAKAIDAYRAELLSLSRGSGYLVLGMMFFSTVLIVILLLDVRTSRETAAQMQRVAREAQAVGEAKENFTTVVSHELRTPLTSVLASLQLLDLRHGKELSAEASHLTKIARHNGERLLMLVNDILDSQALAAGKVSLEKRHLDLNQIIHASVERCRTYASRLNVELVTMTSAESLPVLADHARISQVLSNLLSNAAKFGRTGDGGIVEIISYRTGNWAQVDIVDHGPGVPDEHQANLFSPFYQALPGTGGPDKSSGLGLSISKQLIELHDGRIGFRSAPGSGSTFWFALELHARAQESAEVERQPPRLVAGG